MCAEGSAAIACAASPGRPRPSVLDDDRPAPAATATAPAAPSSSAPVSTSAIAAGPNASDAAEERIDRRTVVVLVRAAHDAHLFALGQQVKVGRRDVDAAGRERLVVARVLRRQRAGAVEDRGQVARRERRDVQDDEDGSRKVGGQRGCEPRQRFDAAGGRADGQGPRCQAAASLLSLRGGACGASTISVPSPPDVISTSSMICRIMASPRPRRPVSSAAVQAPKSRTARSNSPSSCLASTSNAGTPGPSGVLDRVRACLRAGERDVDRVLGRDAVHRRASGAARDARARRPAACARVAARTSSPWSPSGRPSLSLSVCISRIASVCACSRSDTACCLSRSERALAFRARRQPPRIGDRRP